MCFIIALHVIEFVGLLESDEMTRVRITFNCAPRIAWANVSDSAGGMRVSSAPVMTGFQVGPSSFSACAAARLAAYSVFFSLGRGRKPLPTQTIPINATRAKASDS